MADINRGLPIRSQLPGQANYDDVIAKLADGTNPANLLTIDAAGLLGSKLYDGSGTAITSQASGAQRALDVGINVAGVQIDPRQIRALTSADVVTAQQGTSPWVISGTVTANQGGAWTVAATQSGAWTVSLTEDHNYGAVGATTLRTASQIGNATGAANFGNGATGAQTLRVAANLAIGGADVSSTNPVPVSISVDNAGTEVNHYNTASAVASGATSNHDYTVTAGKTLLLSQVEASASSQMKIEVQIETGVATNTFVTRFVKFSSESEKNIELSLNSPISVGAGVRVRVIRTNRDNQAQDLYSTISGQEVP